MRADTPIFYELFMSLAGETDTAQMTKEQAARANEKLRAEGRQSCWLLAVNTACELEQQPIKNKIHA
jgi:hypothetical protein